MCGSPVASGQGDGERPNVATMGQLLAEACRLRLLSGLDDLFAATASRAVPAWTKRAAGLWRGRSSRRPSSWIRSCLVPGVDDSKALSAETRRRLADSIKASVRSWCSVAVDAPTIERVNILEATRHAMHRALERLTPKPDCALVDAVRLDTVFPSVGLVAGDRLCYSVAAASIIAKHERDQLMIELGERYPQYGFAKNKGYAAPEHLEALREFGPSPCHRLTFRKVLPRLGEAVH